VGMNQQTSEQAAVTLGNEKYVLLTTFRKNGTPVGTAIWLVGMGSGKLGFWTGGDSWKVKRLANNANVQLQVCDGRGKVTADAAVFHGTATVLRGANSEEIIGLVTQKYGFLAHLIQFGDKVKGFVTRKKKEDVAILVVLN
jgi:uncharacterized protein